MRWRQYLSAKEVSTYFKNTYETTQQVFSHGVDSAGNEKVYTTESKELEKIEDLRDWIKNSNPGKNDKLFIYEKFQLYHAFDISAVFVPCIQYAWVREENPTIATLINRIETGKELQGTKETKDKLIESAKEFFEPLKKLYVTKKYLYPNNKLSESHCKFTQEITEEPLFIDYRYSCDLKLIVEIKFSINNIVNNDDDDNVAYIGFTQKDFDSPLESSLLIDFSRVIEAAGRNFKIKKEKEAKSDKRLKDTEIQFINKLIRNEYRAHKNDKEHFMKDMVTELNQRFKTVELDETNNTDMFKYSLVVNNVAFYFEEFNGYLHIRSENIDLERVLLISKKSKELLESTKSLIKNNIRKILEKFYFELNDQMTHARIKRDILFYLNTCHGNENNFDVFDFKVNDDYCGYLQFKVSSNFFNWTVSLTTIGINFEEKRGI
jgi:hypothetical protein